MDDVRTYFKGKSWPSTEVNGDQFHGVSIWNFRVDFVQNDPEYKIEIISPEDPEDSDSFTTRDPISDIKKFLSKGMSDTEWLKAASDVNYFSDILRRLANSIEKSHHPSIRKVSRLLRRISLIDVGSRIARSMSDDLESLYQQMEKEGWKVKEKIDGESHFLHVDVGDGLYEITIVPSSIQWKYNIEFIGNDDLTISGVTDDPISEYDNWTKNPELAKAYRAFKDSKGKMPDLDTEGHTIHDKSGVAEL
jgi:hypothetical protein